MTAPPPGPGGSGSDFSGSDFSGPELDPDEQRLASLLADLADDPEAPPSTVSAASVLAAARAQAPAADTAEPVPALDVSVRDVSVRDMSPRDVPTADVSARSGGTVLDGRHRFPGRRRAVMVGVLAAACLAAVAAVLIPLSVRSSDTATSAESALDSGTQRNAVADQAGEVPGQSAADKSAAGSAAGSALVPAPEAAGGQADAALPALPPTPQAAGGTAESSAACAWVPLSAAAAVALTLSLPPGQFGAPGELTGPCAAEPVAGGRLPDPTGGSLVVTVASAADGSCVSGSSTIAATRGGTPCVAEGSGVYVATNAAGSQTAYAYANGLEVAVGKDRSESAIPDGAPLTADQLLAAARAVLGTLG